MYNKISIITNNKLIQLQPHKYFKGATIEFIVLVQF